MLVLCNECEDDSAPRCNKRPLWSSYAGKWWSEQYWKRWLMLLVTRECDHDWGGGEYPSWRLMSAACALWGVSNIIVHAFVCVQEDGIALSGANRFNSHASICAAALININCLEPSCQPWLSMDGEQWPKWEKCTSILHYIYFVSTFLTQVSCCGYTTMIFR